MLIWHKNICCDPSSEPSRRDGSDEVSQYMVSMRNKKKYRSIIIKNSLLSKPLWYIKVLCAMSISRMDPVCAAVQSGYSLQFAQIWFREIPNTAYAISLKEEKSCLKMPHVTARAHSLVRMKHNQSIL